MKNANRVVINLFSISLVTMISGCASYWGKVPYNPPSDTEKNIAHVRLIGNPPGFTISQYGNKPAAVDPSNMVILRPTHDLGFPKVNNDPERYKETYYDTNVYAGTPTRIGFKFLHGCEDVGYTFLPEKGETYEFRLSVTDKTGYCVLYASHLKYDSENKLYITENIEEYRGYVYRE
ncbi:TPA: hypothetical protein RZV39_005098 [Escherichia coli]|uniref:hypothetical protein n=1 Tax=Escherichia coli TaxID=562 RepID=UPI0016A4A3CE|nr:hypothetical protein [Escherichia coli]EEY1412683.1 hypothetical protein [Escherichia coli]EEY1417897.1 hypothetical protein [Escherichia coli]EFA6107200.1 hypothetical protein [Escherichia coli]EFC4901933.1 hypothetical protein [Escherichia coli]EFI9294435.1 hypothetical protein [Escherichia coli]